MSNLLGSQDSWQDEKLDISTLKKLKEALPAILLYLFLFFCLAGFMSIFALIFKFQY